MQWKQISVIVFVIAYVIVSIQGVGCKVPIIVDDLGVDSNGYEVRGQTCWYVDEAGNPVSVAYVAIDKDWVDSPDAAVIIAHEFGHVNHPDWSEAQCDAFANAQGVGHIEDAYSGVH